MRFPGALTPAAWRAVNAWVIEKYFGHPSYFTIAGAPYFSFYDLQALLQSFGGVMDARRALDDFRRQAQAAGFPDLHLNAVVWRGLGTDDPARREGPGRSGASRRCAGLRQRHFVRLGASCAA